ncbi:hypothetical protein EHW99_1724 [Erwinia amylovora]|uniref:Uncharacterized protein n=3 Tax=Erwinia amylovora TaxID=552 RepID=A0A831A2T3_ERWAM|nr:hypothetical protein EaACW_1871 [Erwinia amylovora ACW56400]QJQ54428.1 hypothetical protein EHX00_1724 [Erwinia amylovora]CBA20810.1 hypothetical protein predicted by Glimmer/Critica [Erwinia amylovora CFBP1430]CBX80732.1 hypothetical protein predicted by Glimmer/Critica [Erwinia amylovora ATCC BAA-2158]CCO78718.1 hypothetical protein BN432_1920 [Erwinia amylovora Ea356]CCO82512.1 hypothetical protein BN433_1942 [Erwinia amylovora Ea266]CCO86297.1 hypothetical protein BN434_1909 [Erwinia a
MLLVVNKQLIMHLFFENNQQRQQQSDHLLECV